MSTAAGRAAPDARIWHTPTPSARQWGRLTSRSSLTVLNHAVNAFVTFFITVGPVDVASLFVALSGQADPATRRHMALRGTAIGGGVLFAFAFGGEWLLGALGIGLPAFRVGGGILLMLLAVDMVFARHSGLSGLTRPEDEEAGRRPDVSVFPLAVPLIAGPGAIASAILLMAEAGGQPLTQVIVLAMLALVLACTLAALYGAARIVGLLGLTGVNVITRVLGIVLAALAAQYVLDGLRASALLHALGS